MNKQILFNNSRRFKIKYNINKSSIENNTDSTKYIIIPKLFFNTKDKYINADFKGINKFGNEPSLKFIDRKGKVSTTLFFGEKNLIVKPNKLLGCALKVSPNSKNIIDKFSIKYQNEIEKEISKDLKNDILLITPGYPSVNNKYLFGFVHTRVKEFYEKGINVDVVSLNEKNMYTKYTFEGIPIIKMSYVTLREQLLEKQYKKIIIHFFTEEIAQILDAIDTTNTEILIFTHGTDLIYKDYNILTRQYFKPLKEIDNELKSFFVRKDKILNRYNKKHNVKFIFATKWAKERCEKENNISINNYDIIPTYINEDTFKYSDKNINLRTKIVIIRKFDNISTYGIDLDVKTILELSKRDFFEELEFNIYGDGNYYEELTRPLLKFNNVHLHKKFLTHEEIADVHKNNGIALFATRYETMGVSAAEAAASGLVVLSNNIAAVKEVFDNNNDILSNNEDYIDMANKVEKIYKNPELFCELSKKCHETIVKKYNYKNTIEKEIKLLNINYEPEKIKIEKIDKNKLLTIAIASYNVEKYLVNSVMSLLRSKYYYKLEILIINDGSKDKTSEIGKELESLTSLNNDSIVKLVDKENGGHGSAINKGIELATGKYFKLMDGDDYFDTDELDKLIEKLEDENSDMILNNYVEDLSKECKFNVVRHYDFMKPGYKYDIEDLCYDNYGFTKWGPLLSTSTFKTQMLKQANFKISEKCFYVDMELNSLAFSETKTITYYPFNIYIYYIGRNGQSVSPESFKRNYKNHEHVIFRILNDIYYKKTLSENKKEYIKEKILIPLIQGQYYITTEHITKSKPFYSFDTKLKKYTEFYYNEKIVDRKIKIYRATKGHFNKTIKMLVKIKRIFKRGIQ